MGFRLESASASACWRVRLIRARALVLVLPIFIGHRDEGAALKLMPVGILAEES